MVALLVLVPLAAIAKVVVVKDDMPRQGSKKKRKQYSVEDIKRRQSKDAKQALKDAKRKAAAVTGKGRSVKNKKNKAEKKAALQEAADGYTEAAIESTLAMEKAMAEMAHAKTPEELKAMLNVAQDAAKTAEKLANAERVVGIAEEAIEETVVAESAAEKQAEAKVETVVEDVARTVKE